MKKTKIDFPIRILQLMHTSSITGPNMAALYLLRAMDRNNYEVAVASPPSGHFAERLKEIGIRHIPLGFGRYWDIITMLRLIFILGKGKYHILHGHLGRVGPMVCLAGKIARVPAIILTEHLNAASHAWIGGNFVKLFFHRLFHFISNNCLDMVIAVSETTRKSYVLRQGISEEKTATIYNGIYLSEEKDSAGMAIREHLGLSRDALIVGMVSRLVREKGCADFILAAEEVLRHNQNVRFLMVGDGPERQNLQRLAESKNVDKKVIFTGFRPDAAEIMQAIDILVQPSWSESGESFGCVLIEAMAARKSVVASDIGPFLEIIEPGESGLLFPEKDYRTLAQKLNLLLNDSELREGMGRRGYQIVKEKFDARIIARQTEAVYREVLGIR